MGQSSTFYSNFSGSIDDIAIWNKALAAEDINNYYSLASQSLCSAEDLGIGLQENLIGYWPFCGNPNDLAGNNNGSVSGPQLSNDRFGNNNSAYQFDGIDDYIDMNSPIISGQTPVTYSVGHTPNPLKRWILWVNSVLIKKMIAKMIFD